MKKKLVPLLIACFALCGCSNDVSSTDSTTTPTTSEISTSEDSSTSEGSSSSETTTSESTSTTVEEITAVEIKRIVEKPETIKKGAEIDPTTVRLEILWSDNSLTVRNADKVIVDTSSANDGDEVTATAHFKNLTIDFSVRVFAFKEDVITSDLFSLTTTYKEVSYTSGNGNVYNGSLKKATGTDGSTIMGLNDTAGLVLSKSIGAVKDIEVKFDSGTSTSSARRIDIYASNYPFLNVSDLSLDNLNLVGSLVYDQSELIKHYSFDSDYSYFALKANNALQFEYIKISYDHQKQPLSITDLAISGEVSAYTDSSEWDVSNLIVNATFSDESVVDMTRFMDISIAEDIPTSAQENYPINITATYKIDNTITKTVSMNANVLAPLYTTYAKWSYGDESATIGTFNFENLTTGSGNFYQEQSVAYVIGYIELSKTEALFTNDKNVDVIATLSGGSNKTFDAGYEVFSILVDDTGTEIEASKKNVTASLTKTETEYQISYSAEELTTYGKEVRALRICHKKVSRYNTRFHSLLIKG